LTSTPFRILTVVAAVLATVGALLLWNRIPGPRPIRLLSRVGLLLSGYALAAVAALVAINIAYGGLIANWGDLFADPNAGFGMHGKFPHGKFPGHRPGGFPPGMQPPPGWPGPGGPAGAPAGGPGGVPGAADPAAGQPSPGAVSGPG
jgi:hypothetical protein